MRLIVFYRIKVGSIEGLQRSQTSGRKENLRGDNQDEKKLNIIEETGESLVNETVQEKKSILDPRSLAQS